MSTTVVDGNEVELCFLAGEADPADEKMRAAFERAVHRYRPDVRIEWVQTA